MNAFIVLFFIAIYCACFALAMSLIVIFSAWALESDFTETWLQKWFDKMVSIGENLAKRGGRKS